MPDNLLQTLLDATEEAHGRFTKAAETGQRYYDNVSGICGTGAAAIFEVNDYLRKLGKNPLKSADNRIPTNWHRIITDQKAGYLFTYPPQFDAKDSTELAKMITDTLGQDYPKVIKQLCIDATNCGIGWLAYWYNPGELFSYWYVDPKQIRVVFDPASVKPKVKYLIRSWCTTDENKKTVQHHEIWTERDVTYYTAQEHGTPQFDTTMGNQGVMAHSYGRIPFIPFRNNAEGKDDLPMYKQLVDAIDKLVSGFANDVDDMQEIIWVIKNYAGETAETDYDKEGNEITREIDLLQKLKAKKIINVDGDGGVDTLRGEIPFEARREFLTILKDQLYISAMAVNPFPEAVGQASGVYIDFLYSLLELKAGLMETEFRTALDELVQVVLAYKGMGVQPVEQIWMRNKPRNDNEVVQMIAQTPDTVLSDETKTKAHPLAENWQEERKRIEAESKKKAQEAAALLGDAHPPGGDDE
ncbi:MAG: phage portal protein [Candidatus Fimivivens sp.]|nr:phage portal protein [Candidatus Fimivivens sp.]